MKNSDSYLCSQTSPIMYVESSESSSYVVGVMSDIFASHSPDAYYYIDDINNSRRYLFDSLTFRKLDSLLFTASSPIFCFSSQFYELMLTPDFQIPLCCPSGVVDLEASRIKAFLCQHSASARIRPILTSK